ARAVRGSGAAGRGCGPGARRGAVAARGPSARRGPGVRRRRPAGGAARRAAGIRAGPARRARRAAGARARGRAPRRAGGPGARRAARPPAPLMPALDGLDLAALREALAALGADGWLLFDFRSVNPVAGRVLAVGGMGTRRLFVLLPQRGAPVALVHRIELQPL